MNKAELIEALAQRSGLQKQKAKKLLEAYVDIVTVAQNYFFWLFAAALTNPMKRSKTFYLTKGGNLKKVAFFFATCPNYE